MSALRKRKEQTRMQILFAAYQLFTANGFEATTVDAIALQVGVSRKTLFNYFPSKDQLLWEIARDWYEQSPSAPSPEEAGKPALVLLRDIFMDQLHLPEQHRSFMQIALRHSNGMDIDKALLHPGHTIEDRCMQKPWVFSSWPKNAGNYCRAFLPKPLTTSMQPCITWSYGAGCFSRSQTLTY